MPNVKKVSADRRIVFLCKEMEHWRFSLTDDIIVFVAANVKPDARALTGALIRLKAYQSETGIPVTLNDAREILKESLVVDASLPVRVETIQRVIANKYSVGIKDLLGNDRSPSFTLPRQIAMCLACTMTEMSSTDIGRAFGGKSPLTVRHARKKIDGAMRRDPFFLELIGQVKSDIRAADNGMYWKFAK